MSDPRIVKQAKILIEHSTKVKAGDNVVVYADFVARPLVLEIYKQLIKKGANQVKLYFSDYEFAEAYFKLSSDKQLKSFLN